MIFKKGLIFNYTDKCYFIHDIIEFDNKNYIITLDYNNPKDVSVFEYKIINDYFNVLLIDNHQIIRKVLYNSLKKEVA